MLISPPNGSTAPSGPGPPHYRGFTIALRHAMLGRTPLEEWPARRIDLYLPTHNTHKRQTSMPQAGFEPTIPGSERPQTHALHRAPTGIGTGFVYGGQSGLFVKLAPHLLIPRLRISGAVPLIRLYVFMAWTGTTLLFSLHLIGIMKKIRQNK